MSLLEISGLHAAHGLLAAVRGVDFTLDAGQCLALVGANGAGKTTLLRTVAGAHAAASGRVVFGGADVTALPAHRRVQLGLALVPEGRRLFNDMTVAANLRLAGAYGRKGAWTLDRVLAALPQLQPKLAARAGTLSGGQQQAVAIGRALMTNPRLLMLDEISLGLSPIAVDQVYASLGTLREAGTTILLVEQDLGRALAVADHVACMLEGRLVLQAEAGQVTREQVMAAYFGLQRANPAAAL